MKNLYINKRALYLLGVAITAMFSACSDWTENEALEIDQPNIADKNPALYADYLESVKAYKNSDHKCLYVTFDNHEKVPFNRAQHISVIPDSVDIVSLTYPANLTAWEQSEMEETSMDKGTKFIFTIGFDAIKLKYDKMVADQKAAKEGDAALPELPGFTTYLVDSLQSSLSLVKKYKYDGICFGYKGKSILHMTDEEKVEYMNYHNAFIGILKDWSNRNSDKMILFEGKPQNLLDKSFLPSCKYLIISCADAGNTSKLSYNIYSANVEGVPNDRFIVGVETTSLDPSDVKTGYWADGETRAIEGTSIWVAAEYADFTVAGMGIYNVSNDYFSTGRVYQYTRDAIDIINPSLKN